MMMLENVDDLVNELVKGNGKVKLPPCMLVVNGFSLDDMFKNIYMDTDAIGTDDDLVEFCDEFMMTGASIHLSEINEFKIAYEYDEKGYIKG